MKKGYLSQYFDNIAFKRLTSVETDCQVSHQHEFNGTRNIHKMLGYVKATYKAKFIYFTDDDDNPLAEEGSLTWYDAREKIPGRTEWRLYYSPNTPMQLAEEGDGLFIAKPANEESILVIIAEKDSTAFAQLQWLFGSEGELKPAFCVRSDLESEQDRLGLAANFILEQIGISIDDEDENYLEDMLRNFNGKFPASAEFSKYARGTLSDIDCLYSPDTALVAWMHREEVLYRTLEKHLVGEQLKNLVCKDDNLPDTERFLGLAMSTFQRRKARAGSALENHLEEIFQKFSISYTRNGITEQRHKPDFIFPGISQYRDNNFPATHLAMLGAKSTCKDRWRQILTEASRIPHKHLITLEPSISVNQTNEMLKEKVSLVIPASIHNTFTPSQRASLINVGQFIEMIKKTNDLCRLV